MGHICGSGTCHKQENHYLRKLSSDWLTFENKRVQQQPVWVAVSKPEEIQKQEGGGKNYYLHRLLVVLNSDHAECAPCNSVYEMWAKHSGTGDIGEPPPIILSLTIFSLAATFRSLHGSRVRSHCICASVIPFILQCLKSWSLKLYFHFEEWNKL